MNSSPKTRYYSESLTFSFSQDRSLRYEQYYDVITFDDKLKGLEDKSEYPKEKPWYFRPQRDTLADYNIISNIGLRDHYFDAPEKRPVFEEKVPYDR